MPCILNGLTGNRSFIHRIFMNSSSSSFIRTWRIIGVIQHGISHLISKIFLLSICLSCILYAKCNGHHKKITLQVLQILPPFRVVNLSMKNHPTHVILIVNPPKMSYLLPYKQKSSHSSHDRKSFVKVTEPMIVRYNNNTCKGSS